MSNYGIKKSTSSHENQEKLVWSPGEIKK